MAVPQLQEDALGRRGDHYARDHGWVGPGLDGEDQSLSDMLADEGGSISALVADKTGSEWVGDLSGAAAMLGLLPLFGIGAASAGVAGLGEDIGESAGWLATESGLVDWWNEP